ncbi:MAG: HisA/HisF-related TIM barrel protein [Actinomycetota bacterium]|nr:HisA/HisF-related TIM barrel protein [Actinomycetota bacterium]
MDLYPAVDILGGASVRLYQGDFDRKTTYGDAVAAARSLVDAGAERLHVVDLDAARTGLGANAELVEAIVADAGVPVQVGGGLRDETAVAGLLAAGAARVVVGTAVLDAPAMVAEMAERHPGRIAIGLDHDGKGRLAVRGWKEASGAALDEVLAGFAGVPLAGVVVTDITRDGSMEGPDLAGLRHVLATTLLPVVASGGVRSGADLAALAAVEVCGRRLDGVIVGRALADGALGVKEAIAACAPPV